MPPFSRRRFLQLAAGSALGLAAARAAEPFARTGPVRLRLSLAAYSFREFFKETAEPAERRLDMRKFIDYCAEQGCDGAELTSYYFPKDVSVEQMREVRRYAFLKGVAVSGTSVGNNFALPPGPERDKQVGDVKRWIGLASALGAPHIRVFAGAAKGIDPAEARRLCVAALEECCEYAGSLGIFLGLENHGGIVAEPEGLLEIVRAVKSPWLGVNLDTGNFHTADPYAALAMCAPYAVNVQLKTEVRAAGAKQAEPADLARLIGILRTANYQGWVALEYEEKKDPWKEVPPLLAKMRELFQADAVKGADAGKPLFDGKTLDGWKITDFAGRGEVEVAGGQIILDAGNDLTGITLAGEPPRMGYEVELEAQRVTGSDFFCGLTFPVGEECMTYVVGGWGGALVGLSSIDGNDASENETTQFVKFENGRWYRIRLRVVPGKIEGWIDDERMVNLDTEGKRIGMRAGEIELSMPFGIASFRTRTALRNIRLKRL
jgi:sugar phosphate isomerase/epimerase